MDCPISLQFADDALFYGFGDQSVRMKGVDANPSCSDCDDFPSIQQTAPFFSARRDIHGATGFGATCHAARVGAVGCDDSAVTQAYVGEKAFVATNKNAADQPIRKMHEQSYSGCANRFLLLRFADSELVIDRCCRRF